MTLIIIYAVGFIITAGCFLKIIIPELREPPENRIHGLELARAIFMTIVLLVFWPITWGYNFVQQFEGF